MFPRGFWIPPMICGMLAAGCAARTAWTARAFAGYQNARFYYNAANCRQNAGAQDDKEKTAHTEAPSGNTQKSEEQGKTEASSDKKQKTGEQSQMDRVAEIMRASTESTIQALSDIFKQ